MRFDISEMPKVLAIYLQLSEYPILARRIREQMREQLFDRGVMSREQFELEVREKAIKSQEKEGLSDPFSQESPQEWSDRLRIIRDHLTDRGGERVDPAIAADRHRDLLKPKKYPRSQGVPGAYLQPKLTSHFPDPLTRAGLLPLPCRGHL